MAYAVVHTFAGGTEEQYAASLAAVHPADGSLPAGQIFHIGGRSETGWTIVALHDSRASWEAFRDNILGPKLAAGVPGGFDSAPQETTFEVANLTLQGLVEAMAGS